MMVDLTYPQTPLFINEIHYDNAGGDANEGVELAGPAGTDVTGWKVIFYNGNGGAAYDSVGFSGTIPDIQNGFGTTWVDAPGSIQNGPDGLALVSSSGEVVQFLSYEGSFTATDGPAYGLTSRDIQVEESGSTQIGQSLQLSGEGLMYEDFNWMADLPATPDAVNASQTLGISAPADTNPPAFTTGYPKAVNIGKDRFDILVNFSEACTVYYLARMDGTMAPDSLEVWCGDTLVAANPETDYAIHIDTASPASTYDVYFLAADHETPPNIMDSAVLLRVRTKEDINLSLVSPLAGDTVYAGDSVTVTWKAVDIDSLRLSLFDFKGDDWTILSGAGIPAEDSSWKFRIPGDAELDSMILRMADAGNPILYQESGVLFIADTIIPRITKLSPSNGSTGVPLLPSLKIEFNERVYAGTGNIGIYGEFGGLSENIDVTGDQVRFDAYSVQIMLSSSLPLPGRYHILVDPGAFIDYQGNAFGGFSSDTSWVFTTILTSGGTDHLACWEDPDESQIRIYPNPAEERITLEWYGTRPTNLEVEILGMKGMTVYRNLYHSIVRLHENIELQHLAAGIYMLKIRMEEGISITWLVVQ
jgi:hypothetical protein